MNARMFCSCSHLLLLQNRCSQYFQLQRCKNIHKDYHITVNYDRLTCNNRIVSSHNVYILVMSQHYQPVTFIVYCILGLNVHNFYKNRQSKKFKHTCLKFLYSTWGKKNQNKKISGIMWKRSNGVYVKAIHIWNLYNHLCPFLPLTGLDPAWIGFA